MEEAYSVKKLILYTLLILLLFGIFYGITILITNNKKTEQPKETDKEATIQYDEILVGNIYKQNESNYYVLATLKDDINLEKYSSKTATYTSKTGSDKIYTINLSNSFNKKYVGEISNFELEIPVFKTSTLLKIVNNEIIEIYEANDIITELDKLSKE